MLCASAVDEVYGNQPSGGNVKEPQITLQPPDITSKHVAQWHPNTNPVQSGFGYDTVVTAPMLANGNGVNTGSTVNTMIPPVTFHHQQPVSGAGGSNPQSCKLGQTATKKAATSSELNVTGRQVMSETDI